MNCEEDNKSPSIDGSEATLLYKAVNQNDTTVINDLSKAGIDVNAQISSGDTALLVALKLEKFEAVKALLDADADLRVTDVLTGQTALDFLMTKSLGVVHNLAPHFTGNLKRSNVDAENLAELLVAANCPFKHVLSVNNAQVSRKFLELNPSGNWSLEMKSAIDQRNFEIVELILRYGNSRAKYCFYNTLAHIHLSNQIEWWKAFIVRLPDWDVVSEEALSYFDCAFRGSKMERLQILLDSKIDVQVREKLGIDLRASLFGNWMIDAVELLKNQNFKVNASGVRLKTALHYAALNDVIKNVRFLLDSGVHVNIQDINGNTALFQCVRLDRINGGQLLLEHGADVQTINKNGLTVFEIAHNVKSSLVELLIAQLAISGVQGLPIKQSIQDIITGNEEYAEIYATCCQQLQILKTCEILRPITLKISETCEFIQRISLFTVLAEKIETLCRLVQNRDITSLLQTHRDQHELHSLYYSTLKTKLVMTSNRYLFQSDIADIIFERTGNIIDFDHLAVRKISEYSNQKDIIAFLKCRFGKRETK